MGFTDCPSLYICHSLFPMEKLKEWSYAFVSFGLHRQEHDVDKRRSQKLFIISYFIEYRGLIKSYYWKYFTATICITRYFTTEPHLPLVTQIKCFHLERSVMLTCMDHPVLFRRWTVFASCLSTTSTGFFFRVVSHLIILIHDYILSFYVSA